MVVKFKDAVCDSHRHFFEELGIVPTIDDIFEDLSNYEIEDVSAETLDEYYNDIKVILKGNELEYKL